MASPIGRLDLVGTVFKVLGIVLLVGGVLGVIAGGMTIAFGQMAVDDSDDGFLLRDSQQAQDGEEAKAAGLAILGSSLVVCGLGLVFLVAGISVGNRERPSQQQQQQVVLVPNPPRLS